MSILHVISTLNIGGAENFVVQLANEQVKSSKVSIVVLGTTDDKINYMNTVDTSVNLLQLKWKKKYSINQFFQLNTLINKLSAEVVHVHLHNPFYYVYGISFFNSKIKFVHTLHSSFKNWKKVLSYLNKIRFLNNRILHVCISPSILNAVQNSFPLLKTTAIDNGIKEYTIKRNPETIKSLWKSYTIEPQKGSRFLTIGNISGNKNFKLLAQCFEALALKHPKAMCIQIGKPTDERLTEEIRKINAPNVFLAGPHENAADFLLEADALIISSVEEGMPMVALEAMSLGIPILTTPAGGMVDIINGENGFITNNFEVASLKQIVSDYIELPTNVKNKLSINAKTVFEAKYEIKITKNKYELSYDME
jgi:glycosyltransferase involved in cell wall biosynthesis